MPIEFACTNCEKRLRVKDDAAGKRVKCPQCEEVVAIPERKVGKVAQRVVAAELADAASDAAQTGVTWHFKTADGSIFGPVAKVELDEWLSEGRISAESQILRSGDAEWQWASDVYPQLTVASAPKQTYTPPVTPPFAPASYASSQFGPTPAPQMGFAPAMNGPLINTNPFPTNPSTNPYASSAAPTSTYYRPNQSHGGVVAVAVVNFVLSAMTLFCGFILMIGGSFIASMSMSVESDVGGAVSALIVLLGLFYLVFGFLLILGGVGLLMRKNWGRILTLVLGGLAAIPALLSLLAIFTGEISSIVGLVIWGGYCVLVFGVLLNGQTARWFRAQHG